MCRFNPLLSLANTSKPAGLAFWRLFRVLFLGPFCALLLSSSGQAAAQIAIVPGIITVAGNGTSGESGDGGPATSAELINPVGIATDRAGNLYIAAGCQIRKVDPSWTISTVAGTGRCGYSGDGGPATSAKLGNPMGIATDGAGNLYIADTDNNVIRMVTRSTGIITTVAGNGGLGYSGDGGPATSAMLSGPQDVAVDGAGNLYISDYGNRVIRKVSPSGTITTVAGGGTSGGCVGPATSAELGSPMGVAIDGAGNLYFADGHNDRICKLDASTGMITTVAGNGTLGYSGDGGPATSAELNGPMDVAVDGAGNLYIVDGNNVIRVVSPTGTITTVAGNGTLGYSGDGGPAISAELSSPWGVAVDSSGDIYIADSANNRIRKVNLSSASLHFLPTPVGSPSAPQNLFLQLTADQSISSVATAKSQGGKQEYALGAISGCVVDGSTVNVSGTICTAPITFRPAYPGQRSVPLTVVTNTGAYSVGLSGMGTGPQVAFTPGVINTVAGTGTSGYSGDGGPATSAKLNNPLAVVIDVAGDLYIADSNNSRVRKVSASTGIITTVAGNGTWGYSGDGGPATSAEMSGPGDVAVDGAGNLYITDTGDYRVRKVSASTGIITTVAGNGTSGYSGDGGPATSAEMNPESVALDGAGNLYITDNQNDVVRKVDATTGTITTVAGNGTGGYSGDGGPATSAELHTPVQVGIDGAGNLYIADLRNNRIRKVDAATGTITTVAGDGTGGYSGDGGPATSAELNNPQGVAVDAAGDIYISDFGDNRIREVNATTGIITTLAGNGTGGYSGDVGPATSAELNNPQGVAVDAAGNIYFADTYDRRIREINVSTAPSLTFPATAVNTTSSPQTVSVENIGNTALTFPPPTSGLNPSVAAYFSYDSSSTCPQLDTASSEATVASGTSCTMVFDFAPTVAGTIDGSAVLTDDDLNAAFPNYATQTISLSGVAQETPVITWATPVAITYGTPLSSTQLDATASVPGTFIYSPAIGSTLSGGAQVLTVTFTPTDTTDYMTATATVNLSVTRDPVTVNIQSSLNPSVYGSPITYTFTFTGVGGMAVPTGQAAITLDGNSIGTVTLDSSGNATLSISTLLTGSHTVKAVYGGDTNYF